MALPRRKVKTSPIKKSEKEYLNHLCDECSFSKIYNGGLENLDYKGEPIFITCPYEDWRIVRETKQACFRFKEKLI